MNDASLQGDIREYGFGSFLQSGNAGDADDLIERDIDIDILQIMDPGPSDFYFLGFFIRHALSPSFLYRRSSCLKPQFMMA